MARRPPPAPSLTPATASSWLATSSQRSLDTLPPLATLQAWVHRPQAIAACFISDVYALQAICEDDGEVKRISRDVFLLNCFPCRFVRVVGWVSGIDHKEGSMVITIDDGDGVHAIQAVVRLAEIELPATPKKGKPVEKETFRSSRARREERLKAGPSLPVAAPKPKVYAPLDLRVGDTVRVTGRVDEWQRRDGVVRQIIVDEGSGTGSILVVDPDEQYYHLHSVLDLHREVYSQPFTMPSLPAIPSTLPCSLPASAQVSPAKSSLSSTLDTSSEMSYEDDDGPDLPHPSTLSSSRLTDATFKIYLVDHMARETARIMKVATRALIDDPGACVSTLAAVFPEYRMSMTRKPKTRREKEVFTPSQRDNTPPEDTTPKPKRTTFKSKAERERERARQQSTLQSPSLASMPLDPFYTPVKTPSRPTFMSQEPRLEPFTLSALLADPSLRLLVTRVVDQRARHEEKLRRRRLKDGSSTAKDLQVVAARRARGVSSSEYRLTESEREGKILRLGEWAIRTAAGEGGVVHIALSSASPPKFRDRASLGPMEEVGYLPLVPELVGPLLVPLVEAERARRATVFARQKTPMDAPALTKRLRAWGEEGRWERAGEWTVEQGLEWAEAVGIVKL